MNDRTPRDNTHGMLKGADRYLFLAAGMSDRRGGASFIEEQEANGQREIVNATTLPTDMRDPEKEFLAVGFAFGEVVAGDPLFRAATLPDGWKRQASDHSMGSYIVDELGRRRVSIFYKAAFYDRSAHMSLTNVYGYVSTCLYEGTTPILDDQWATREAVLEAVGRIREQAEAHVEKWTQHRNDEYVAEYREEVAKCDALKAQFEQQDGALSS